MKSAAQRRGSRLKPLLSRLLRFARRAPSQERAQPQSGRYLRTYECFREILNINDSTLQLIADIDGKLLGQAPFNLDPLFQRIRKAVMEVFLMVNNLNEIGEGRFLRLHDALGRIQLELEAEIGGHNPAIPAGLVVPVSQLRASDAWFAGSKMANLGEAHSLGFSVPDGFVITTEAYRSFMTANRLGEEIVHLETLLDSFSTALLDAGCREIQQAIHAAATPTPILQAIHEHFDELAKGEPLLVAMRSSAVGEDTSASFAGKFYTELNVTRGLLEDAYRTVVSSMFSADAILYRYERGLNDGRTRMAVGCIRMIDPQYSGIMFSREFHNLDADQVVISSRRGLNAGVTSGTQDAEEIVIGPESSLEGASRYLSSAQLASLKDIARRLESHFGVPQDIEWAIDAWGAIFVLQCRPMIVPPPVVDQQERRALEAEPLLSGGMVACPGVGCGPVYVVRSETDLERFPSGGVVVARHSSPAFSRVMTRCAAIITEIGSPIGHMAILAREFGVPTIVGMKDALDRLSSVRVVSVDADNLCLYEGEMFKDVRERAARFPLAGSPIVQRLSRAARWITPLKLTDPSAADFKPSACGSLHDITRFIHEKVYEVMFHLGDRTRGSHGESLRLEAHLPIEIRVFDVGGGIAKSGGAAGLLKPDDIRCVPMKAFLEGLFDPRIRWSEPRPVSASGFMSVMGENIAGPPARSRGVGGASFAVISDRYMNFSTKAGYHFSTLDVYCGQSQNKNYIHFKFHGGGASLNRRMRRINFLTAVLTGLEIKVQTQGDLLVARLDKYERDFLCSTLVDLGRLTMCVRQLDMLMDSDAKASALAQSFLRGEFSNF